MMHIFPHEFGLHNVFTSVVDSRETVQPLKDYTLREEEISRRYGQGLPPVPKRLRWEAMELVKSLQTLHSRCPYKELLEYYCPAIIVSL
jgi:telomerase reverse transcriptase